LSDAPRLARRCTRTALNPVRRMGQAGLGFRVTGSGLARHRLGGTTFWGDPSYGSRRRQAIKVTKGAGWDRSAASYGQVRTDRRPSTDSFGPIDVQVPAGWD
jgi:hypothetical protein